MAIGPNTADLDAVTELAIEGAQCEGDHHKQWYLMQICRNLGLTDEDLQMLELLGNEGIEP